MSGPMKPDGHLPMGFPSASASSETRSLALLTSASFIAAGSRQTESWSRLPSSCVNSAFTHLPLPSQSAWPAPHVCTHAWFTPAGSSHSSHFFAVGVGLPDAVVEGVGVVTLVTAVAVVTLAVLV